MPDSDRRPAYYSARPGGWRDWWSILHPPYTAWHLSYVVIGASLAPHLDSIRLLATVLAFFAAVGIAAHALDERHGHPLRTHIPDGTLLAAAGAGLVAAVALGVAGLSRVGWVLLPFIVVGPILVVAYNLELFGGAFHSTLWFALAWGSLPALAAYVVEAETLRLPALAVAVYAALLSYAQRVLSTPARAARREAGTVRPELETALRALAAASVAIAVAVLLVHV